MIVPPGFTGHICGREAYIQSYRDAAQSGTTFAFSLGAPEIDVVGDVAVAVCPFVVVYEREGTMYREAGHDLLVLS